MIKTQIQPPGNGCDNCGKWKHEPDCIKLKRLRFDGTDWLCTECRRDKRKREE
jgi:hypothetical protein